MLAAESGYGNLSGNICRTVGEKSFSYTRRLKENLLLKSLAKSPELAGTAHIRFADPSMQKTALASKALKTLGRAVLSLSAITYRHRRFDYWK